MNKLQYAQLSEFDTNLVQEFMNTFELKVDDNNYDLSYLNADWWDAPANTNRNHDVKMAWGRFNTMAMTIQEGYMNWLRKYYWWFKTWQNIVKLEAVLPELTAKLTKPLHKYATGRRQNAKANAVRVVQKQLNRAYRDLAFEQQIPVRPPSPNPDIDEAWAYYQSILALTIQLKKQPKPPKPEYKPIIMTVNNQLPAKELLTVLKNYPRTTEATSDPKYYIDCGDGLIIRADMLYDWVNIVTSYKVFLLPLAKGLEVTAWHKRGTVFSKGTFLKHKQITTENKLNIVPIHSEI